MGAMHGKAFKRNKFETPFRAKKFAAWDFHKFAFIRVNLRFRMTGASYWGGKLRRKDFWNYFCKYSADLYQPFNQNRTAKFTTENTVYYYSKNDLKE